MMSNEPTVFVPNGDSRTETAVLLVGTARTEGFDQREIRAARSGFYVSQRVHDAAYDGAAEPKQAEPKKAQKSAQPEQPDYDPAEGTVAEVKKFVTKHPEHADEVLASERRGKNRSSLTEWLADHIASGNRAAKNEAQDKE